MLDLSDLRHAWQLPPILTTWTPETGTIHRTLLLKTSQGDYALRAYRYGVNDRGRIISEHALIRYAQAHNLPALTPLPLPNGETILEQDGHFYALFPFARGQQTSRNHLTSDLIMSMGRFLGEIHQVLHNYPQANVHQRSFTVDHATTLATMEKIEAAIHSQPSISDEDTQTLSRLAERRAWLAAAPSVEVKNLATLEQQVIHGDYQETNLFFEDGQVSAIIDWDQSYVAPRAWEVVRTLHYVCKLQGQLCRVFLDAYRRVLPLTAEDLETAAAVYGWIRAHDLWHYQAIYLEGNQRVRTFLQPGPFIPFVERWTALQEFLNES